MDLRERFPGKRNESNNDMRKLLLMLCLLTALTVLSSCAREPSVAIRTGSPVETPTQSETPTPDTPSVTPVETPTQSETPTPDTPSVTPSETPAPDETPTPVTPTPVTPTPDTPTPTPTPTPVTPTPVTPTPMEPPSTPTPSDDTPWILHETADAGLEYQNQLIFFGDSTTAGMFHYKSLPDGENTKQIWSGKKWTFAFMYYKTEKIVYPETGEQMLFKDAVALKKPEYLVITLGVSGGVSYLDEEGFKSVYRMILDDIIAVSPDTQIIIQSIYPVEKSGYHGVTNDMIIRCNPYILDLAEEYYKAGKHVYFSDPFSALAGSDGYLPSYLGNGDGLHLCTKGFEVVLKYIRTHALTLQ